MPRPLLFILRFSVLGLALAFIAVLIWPRLLQRPAAPAPFAGAARTVSRPPVTSYADAVARSAAAVVNIYTARVIVPERGPTRRFGEPAGDLWPGYRERVENSLGSGVIIDGNGHIVTNNHVVASASSILVQVADGRIAQATIVGRDPDTDLAVLEIDLEKLPTMPLGRSDTLRVGDVVLAIGSPVGLSQTVTQGIVSATGRGLGVATFENFIQTDAAINVGNSGGALINTEGQLVGINTAVFSRSAGIEGIGFAIPVNLVRGVMQEIFRNGRVIRGWLGVVPQDLQAEQARALGLQPGAGVLVVDLYLNSPVHRAGVRAGDVLTHLNKVRLTSRQQALAYVATLAPGSQVKIRGVRNGQVYEAETKVEERPSTR